MSSPGLFPSSRELRGTLLPHELQELSSRFDTTLLNLSRRKFDRDTDIHRELGVLAEQACHSLGAEAAGVWLFSEDRSKLLCVDRFSAAGRTHEQGAQLRTTGELEQFFGMLRGSRSLTFDAAESGPQASFVRALPLMPEAVHVSCAGIWSGGDVIGVLALEHAGDRNSTVIEQQFFASVSDLAGVLIQSAERLRLESHIEQAQKLEGLKILASALAHDLTNLVMSITGSAGLLLTEMWDGDKARQRVERIKSAAQRAGELAMQLSVFLGKDRLVVRPINLTALVSQLQLLLETAASKKAVLEFDLDEDVPMVGGEASQLRQLLLNLVTNASEALGGKEGTITIMTGIRYASEQFLKDAYHGGDFTPGRYAYLQVSDTRSGIKEEIQQRIFDPFFSTKVSGSGLNLAGVLGIARAHGAAVHVSSRVGSGTAFSVLFKIAQEGTEPGQLHGSQG